LWPRLRAAPPVPPLPYPPGGAREHRPERPATGAPTCLDEAPPFPDINRVTMTYFIGGACGPHSQSPFRTSSPCSHTNLNSRSPCPHEIWSVRLPTHRHLDPLARTPPLDRMSCHAFIHLLRGAPRPMKPPWAASIWSDANGLLLAHPSATSNVDPPAVSTALGSVHPHANDHGETMNLLWAAVFAPVSLAVLLGLMYVTRPRPRPDRPPRSTRIPSPERPSTAVERDQTTSTKFDFPRNSITACRAFHATSL
jgi:hypothetical protein